MTRRCRILLSVFFLGMATATTGASQQPSRDLRAQVRALADSGKLGEAERIARAGGPALVESLGEVLVLRGRLSEARSALTEAVRGDATARRSAEAALGELAFRHGDRGDALRIAGAQIGRAHV